MKPDNTTDGPTDRPCHGRHVTCVHAALAAGTRRAQALGLLEQ